jgi:hypothetical protein
MQDIDNQIIKDYNLIFLLKIQRYSFLFLKTKFFQQNFLTKIKNFYFTIIKLFVKPPAPFVTQTTTL